MDTPVSIEGDINYIATFEISKKHQILPLAFNGLYKLVGENEETEKFRSYTYGFISKDQNLLFCLEKIEACFREGGIEYMPLKGAAIKKYYPSSEMRLMSDIDILIKEEQYGSIRALFERLGFRELRETNHELIWQSDTDVTIELHKRLIPSYNDDYYAYYAKPWSKATIREGCRFSMKPEDEYIYVFTHMTKHYRDGGIGLRHIIDIYYLPIKNPDLDWDYIRRELGKLGLLEFYGNILDTIDVWFNGKEETPLTAHITERIAKSGAYGLKEQRDRANAARVNATSGSLKSAKRKALRSMIIIPYGDMKKKYPILNKCPILLPVMWVVRWVNAIFRRKLVIKNQMMKLDKMDEAVADTYNQELELVGLRYNLNRK